VRFLSRWLPVRFAGLAVALAAGAGGFASPVLAGPAAAAAGPVSETPAAGTPALGKTHSIQDIRQIVRCGTSYRRAGVFSFSAVPPYTLTGLDPEVNGEVDSIAFAGGNCSAAYIGGSFTSVHGTPATNLAEISTSTGAVVPAFGHDANGTVDTLAGYGNHLLAGGQFTQVNGSVHSYYASLNPVTGLDDGFVKLNVHGFVPGSDQPEVYNQQLSHGGTLELVEGNFTSAGGLPRQQIFMLNLATSPATVTGWTSPEFSQHCQSYENFYVRTAAWAPDDSTVYVGDTGNYPAGWNHTFPLTGICDAVAAFPATQSAVSHRWVNYSGCDSYYSVAADTGAVYAAGHPRWADNASGCEDPGTGAVQDYGLQGLHPGTGTAELRSGHARWTMSRANADSMLITRAGLWIASTNRYGADACNGVGGHAGLCLLPYRAS
jgi:hypothetical protein